MMITTVNHIYALDANIFIEASRRYYAFDLVGSFWVALVEQAENGFIKSIKKVQKELERGDDELVVGLRQNLPLILTTLVIGKLVNTKISLTGFKLTLLIAMLQKQILLKMLMAGL